jgi:Tfp pilus assembly protein PilV
MTRFTTRQRLQTGVFLIEALIAALIFSLGILALLSVATTSIAAQSGAQTRSEASQAADDIAQAIWLTVDRSSATALRDSLMLFQHQIDGDNCEYSGDPSSQDVVTNWVTKITTGSTDPVRKPLLPGATTAMQQIKVDSASGTNQVTINICWRSPSDFAARRHTMTMTVN